MKSPRDALGSLRELFVSTHWTKGEYSVIDAAGKARYCAVGGCRHVLAASPHQDLSIVELEESHLEFQRAYVAMLLPMAQYARARFDASDLTDRQKERIPLWSQTLDRIAARAPEDISAYEISFLECFVVEFNDDPATTLDDILAMIDEATVQVAA